MSLSHVEIETTDMVSPTTLDNFLVLDGHPWESEDLTDPAILGPSSFHGQKGLTAHHTHHSYVQQPQDSLSGPMGASFLPFRFKV